jgi:hypothetical protein
LAVGGSILSAVVGFALLLILAVARYINLNLALGSNGSEGKVKPMANNDNLKWCAVLETIWSVGVSTVAGALPT